MNLRCLRGFNQSRERARPAVAAQEVRATVQGYRKRLACAANIIAVAVIGTETMLEIDEGQLRIGSNLDLTKDSTVRIVELLDVAEDDDRPVFRIHFLRAFSSQSVKKENPRQSVLKQQQLKRPLANELLRRSHRRGTWPTLYYRLTLFIDLQIAAVVNISTVDAGSPRLSLRTHRRNDRRKTIFGVGNPALRIPDA